MEGEFTSMSEICNSLGFICPPCTVHTAQQTRHLEQNSLFRSLSAKPLRYNPVNRQKIGALSAEWRSIDPEI